MLDRVLEDSKSLSRKLGKQDQDKFEEYLSSVRQIEQRVERSKAGWRSLARIFSMKNVTCYISSLTIRLRVS